MELAINTSGRKKLIIGEVKAKKPVGEAEVVEFFAKIEGEENSTKYGAWSKDFYDLVKTGAVLDCDIVVKPSTQRDPDGNFYQNRKVAQIYIDGKPVKEQHQGKSWGKSPETTLLELDSKARNTALMQACEIGKEDTIEEILCVAGKFYAWLKGEVKPAMKAPEKPVVKEVVKQVQQEAALPSQMSVIDQSWLSVTMKAVNWKDATLKSWLKMQFKVDTTGTIEEILSRCDPNQINMLVNHLNTMAEASGVK